MVNSSAFWPLASQALGEQRQREAPRTIYRYGDTVMMIYP